MSRRGCYEAVVWWWYRTTGRDCQPWIQSLADRGGTVRIPRGTYRVTPPIALRSDMYSQGTLKAVAKDHGNPGVDAPRDVPQNGGANGEAEARRADGNESA